MNSIYMKVNGLIHKIKEGRSKVGSCVSNDIVIPNIPLIAFLLDLEQYFMWISPLCDISKINGLSQTIKLNQQIRYEIDVTTGNKIFIVEGVAIEFYYSRSKFKIKIIEKNPPRITRSSDSQNGPKTSKLCVNDLNQRIKHSEIIAMISEIKVFKLKFSNCRITEQELIPLTKMGMQIDATDYNILVMDKFKRTVGLLIALNEGKLVVNYSWIRYSIYAMKPENPYQYILKSKQFNAIQAILRARTKLLFSGLKLYAHPQSKMAQSVQADLQRLVESGGGEYVNDKETLYIVQTGQKGGVELEQFYQSILFQDIQF